MSRGPKRERDKQVQMGSQATTGILHFALWNSNAIQQHAVTDEKTWDNYNPIPSSSPAPLYSYPYVILCPALHTNLVYNYAQVMKLFNPEPVLIVNHVENVHEVEKQYTFHIQSIGKLSYIIYVSSKLSSQSLQNQIHKNNHLKYCRSAQKQQYTVAYSTLCRVQKIFQYILNTNVQQYMYCHG